MQKLEIEPGYFQSNGQACDVVILHRVSPKLCFKKILGDFWFLVENILYRNETTYEIHVDVISLAPEAVTVLVVAIDAAQISGFVLTQSTLK